MQKIVTATLFLFGISLAAQDTRTVTEPKIPAVCAELVAEKRVNDHKLLVVESADSSLKVADRKFDFTFDLKTDTARIQQALDHCKPGMAVELKPVTETLYESTGKQPKSEIFIAKNAFLSGSLELREGVTLLIDKGVTLYASRDPKDFDADPKGAGPLLCGTMSDISRVYITAKDAAATPGKTMPQPKQGRTCKALITINVKNAAIMGEGTIDGRGDAVVMGHYYTWWQMARAAEPKQLAYYSGRLITASHADGLILYGIHLNNAPNCHVCVNNTNGFTAWGVHLQTPTVKGTDARNTDGIDPGSSTNVTIAHSWIDNGDDNIAIKAGVTHMSVLDNHFYDGHGMSIGSEVANDAFILVDGLTEDHTTSGIRIKSNNAKGGPVHDLTFENICMRDVKIPIAISPYYNNGTVEGFTDPGVVGDHIPDYKKIVLDNIYDESAGDVLIAGKDDEHRTEVSLDAVHIEGLQPSQVHLAYVDIEDTVCSAHHDSPQTNLLQGVALPASVKIIPWPQGGCGGYAKHSPDVCAAQFVPYQ